MTAPQFLAGVLAMLLAAFFFALVCQGTKPRP